MCVHCAVYNVQVHGILYWNENLLQLWLTPYVTHRDDGNDDTEYIMRMSRENIHAIFCTKNIYIYPSSLTHTHTRTYALSNDKDIVIN